MGEINVTQMLLTIIGFLIVYTLNGIKGDITSIKGTIASLETDFRGGMSKLDRRITIIETRCVDKNGCESSN